MATLIAFASASIGGASTFKGAETGASALTMIRANTTTLASNTAISSPTFTATNAKVFDGVLLWLMATAATPAGTLLVEIQKGGVTQTSVTVNCADLAHSATGTGDVLTVVPHFFKFTGTATGDGGANWTIKLTTSNNASATITYSRNSATSGDFTKAIRTTTSATAAAADDLYITGEFSGAGTHNSFSVTMDGTSAVQYGNGTVNSTAANGGGIRICPYGTLTFGTTASTNYYLQIKGDLEVYWNGTFNCGVAGGSEIPRGSGSAILEFVMNSAAGDFGLIARNGSTVSIAGLSRTSAKNISWSTLTADLTGSDISTSTTTTNGSTVGTATDVSGISPLAGAFTDNATASATHSVCISSPSISNTTQIGRVWLAQGSGTHNRFVRVGFGNNTAWASATNGFYSDVDLQAGTAGTITAFGNGTATSVNIQASGPGYVVTVIGKVSSGAATPSFHVVSCSAATTTSYTGDTTQCYRYMNWAILTGSSLGDTTISIADDTGWLTSDCVIVTTTTRTYQDNEIFALNANAGASSFTTPMYPFGRGGQFTSTTSTHSGTSPTQGNVGNITRNIRIRSSSGTLWSYMFCEPLASVASAWAEFYYWGSNNTNKFGITIQQSSGTATAKSFTYCSLHDCWTSFRIDNNNSNSANATISNNVIYNTSSQVVNVAGVITLGDLTFSNNLMVKLGTGFTNADMVSAYTNNVLVGTNGNGWLPQPSANASPVNFSGNVSRCNNGDGFRFSWTGAYSGTLDGCKSWRNNGIGMYFSNGQIDEMLINNPTIFGNSSDNIRCDNNVCINIRGGSISGDATFSTATGINFQNVAGYRFATIDSVDMSGSGTGLAAHTTQDLNIPSNSSNLIQCRNVKFGAPSVLSSASKANLITTRSGVLFQRYNQTAGDHRCELKYGQLKTDTTFFNTVSPSMRMTPNSAANKLESATRFPLAGDGVLAAVVNGGVVNVSVWIRKSAAGDGAAYNGNQPRLIQRANPALGQNADVVLATYSSGTGSWNQLSATSSTATDDGVWEFIVDCDGTAGWINVDDWAPSPAKYWFNGLPERSLPLPNPAPIVIARGTPY